MQIHIGERPQSRKRVDFHGNKTEGIYIELVDENGMTYHSQKLTETERQQLLDTLTRMDNGEVEKQLIKRRQRWGVSQKELSDMSGVPIETISEIERYKIPPKHDIMRRLNSAMRELIRQRPHRAQTKEG